MTRYVVHMLDYGGDIYSTRDIEHDDDEAAITAAHALNVLPGLGRFEVWREDRLVLRHPDRSSAADPRPKLSS